MYVFDPMNTLLYDVPLNETGNVNELGALHVSATCALPAVPVTLVGMAEALAIDEEDPTTTKVASTEASTRLSEKNLRKACRRWRFSRINTCKEPIPLLQIDGGVSESTIEIAANSGANCFVAGSAVYKSNDPSDMVKKLRNLAEKSFKN